MNATASRGDPPRNSVTVGVVRAADVPPTLGLPGHPGIAARRLLRPRTAQSRWLHVTLNAIDVGGGIDAHIHDGIDADHAYFVIEGTVRARIGDEMIDAGPNDLLVFPCDVVHGFTVTSPGGARVLRLGAAADGRTSGNSVFVDDTADRAQ